MAWSGDGRERANVGRVRSAIEGGSGGKWACWYWLKIVARAILPRKRASGLVYLIECRLEMEMRRRSFVCMGLVSAAGLVTVYPTAAQKSGHVTSISSLATSIGRKAEEVRADISATRTHSLPNLVRI